MLWELILLIVSITVLCSYGLLRDLYIHWRNQQRADFLGKALAALEGKPAWEAEKQFGPPSEIVSGTSGRQLYIWKALSLPKVPQGTGLVVLTLTVGSDGGILHTHMQKRGGDV
jgi:hypothetical protein